jgi:hypothetical protein
MSTSALIQLGLLVGLIAISTPVLGTYLAKVYGGRELELEHAPGDRVFLPVERAIYRLGGIDAERKQRWNVYALSVVAFSLFSVLFVEATRRGFRVGVHAMGNAGVGATIDVFRDVVQPGFVDHVADSARDFQPDDADWLPFATLAEAGVTLAGRRTIRAHIGRP